MPIANQTRTSLSVLPFTSSEPGAWSNSYLISGRSEAVLFDVFVFRSDAAQIADEIAKAAKTLSTVMISHAHPDHFRGLEVIRDRFPQARVVSSANVVADIKADGPWMFSMLQNKFGAQGPNRLAIPDVLAEPLLSVDRIQLEVAEFGEGEAKHNAAVHIPEMKALSRRGLRLQPGTSVHSSTAFEESFS